ncbi:penicillin-binding transpeptidase domain-containing protein, partial [Megamonas funiformis]|uniref:penicillin-binding transpeptidase domain-containing protein n=1 Tax=Megamonas funiformis TaxID=437897 RepID=UPI003F7EB69C
MIFVVLIIMFGLAFRIGWIQFKMGNKLQHMAHLQQTLEREFNPKRGTIYDATGEKILAVSASVESITVNPVNISSENKERVARKLSELFELDYEKVLKKVSKRSSIETIAKKVDKSKTDELRIWLDENNITTGVNIDVDTKRYYPYNSLAAQIIGFCGSDNQGLMGIEAKYDSELKGQNGSIVKLTDAKGGNLDDEGEEYVKAINGNDLILSIDATIQGIAEKYLEEACIDNVCTDGGNIVIMDPNNGDILAMAGYPTYNLNDPYVPMDSEVSANWDNLSKEEKTAEQQKMWRNKAISDAYEPGSTFKLITSSASLEEKITDTDNGGEFCCTGSITISGVTIKCWRYYRPHGSESLRQALMNSCNPVFIGLGQKLGVKTYYSYLNKFGFLRKTGIDLQGEGGSIFLAEEKVGPVELGTIAFGQRFEVTPIQMITAVSSIANGGTYVVPRVVKGIINSQTGEVKNIEPQKKETVISKETSEKVLSMMQSVVAEGTGKNAQVKGYSIGGKTGTSEDGVNTGKYVTSFVGVAPISNPKLVILITLYNPTGEGGHQGGGVAAPIASQVLGEVLPYLEVKKDNEKEEDVKNKVAVPNLEGMTIVEAKKVLKDLNLNLEYNEENTENEEERIITEQVPVSGVEVLEESSII